MDLQVDSNKGTITNVPEDKDGVQRPVDGAITFAVDNPGIVTLVSEDEGKTVQVIPVGPGRVTYTASADADLGAGVKLITSNTIVITVTAAAVPEATHIVSTEGPVVPQ